MALQYTLPKITNSRRFGARRVVATKKVGGACSSCGEEVARRRLQLLSA